MFKELLVLAVVSVVGFIYHRLTIRRQRTIFADCIGIGYFFLTVIGSAISGRGWIDESDIVMRALSGLTCVCINVSILALWQVHLIRVCEREASSKERMIVGILIAGLSGAIAWFCFGKDVLDLPTRIVGTAFGCLVGGGLYSIYCLWHLLEDYPADSGGHKTNSRSSGRLPYGLFLGLPIVAVAGPTFLFLGGVIFSAVLTETLLCRRIFLVELPSSTSFYPQLLTTPNA